MGWSGLDSDVPLQFELCLLLAAMFGPCSLVGEEQKKMEARGICPTSVAHVTRSRRPPGMD